MNTSYDPNMSATEMLYEFRNTYNNKEASISFSSQRSGQTKVTSGAPPLNLGVQTSSKRAWKDSLIIYGGIIVLLIMIPIVLNSSLEAKLNNIESPQLELQTINCKSFVNYTGKYVYLAK